MTGGEGAQGSGVRSQRPEGQRGSEGVEGGGGIREEETQGCIREGVRGGSEKGSGQQEAGGRGKRGDR